MTIFGTADDHAMSSLVLDSMTLSIDVHDWTVSPLGPLETWPVALRVSVRMMLKSEVPACVAWGTELTFLYNDAFAAILGSEPAGALGRAFRDVWAEVWSDVRPLIDRTLAGEIVSTQNMAFHLIREGHRKKTGLTFSFVPLHDAEGNVAGLLCTSTETVQRVQTDEKVRSPDVSFEREATLHQDTQRDEAFITGVLAASPDCVKILSTDGRLEFMNERGVEINQLSSVDTVLGKEYAALWPEEEREKIRAAVASAVDGKIARAEGFGPTAKGQPRWWEVSFASFQPDTGPLKLIGVTHDITDRVLAEQDRQVTANLLQELNTTLEAQVAQQMQERSLIWQFSLDMLLVSDLAGVFLNVNPAWMAALGWTHDELVGRTSEWMEHPDDRAKTRAQIVQLSEGLHTLMFENRLCTRNGDYRTLSWTVALEGDKLFCVARDITKERRQTTALLEQAAQLRLFSDIVQASEAPICAFNTELRLIAFNRAHSDEFYRIFGYRVQLGDVFPDLFSPEQAPIMRSFMERALTGEAYTVTEEFGDPDMVKPYWEVTYYPLRDPEGRIVGAFHYAKDITARLRAAAELNITQEALRQSQKMEAIGQLTGGIAHDFNNMLATITSSLELMNRRIASGKGGDLTRYLTLASTAAQSAAALIKRLLAFSRKQTLDLQALEVNALIAQMQDMLKRSIGEHIQFELALQPGVPAVKSDRNQLENALLNLTINARDAMPEGGVIRITTSSRELDASYAAMHPEVSPGQYVMVSVTDNGTGMSPEVMAKAFDPFFTTKPIGQGTGLGLSMIYGFARQTRGHASIHSIVGKGTTVNVYLPCNLTTLETPVTQQQSIARSPKGRGETVLFVEDEPGVRLVLGEILGELGYDTYEAIDAPSALEIEQGLGHLDLLVTDVGLPGTNGRQLAEIMRERRPSLKVLFVTGYANKAETRNEFLGHGMDMLAKPFTIDALANKVQMMLNEPVVEKSVFGIDGDSIFGDLAQ